MSTLEDLDDMEREEREDKEKKEKKEGDGTDDKKTRKNTDVLMEEAGKEDDEEKEEDILDDEIRHSSTRDIQMRKRLLENDLRIMKSEYQRLTHEQAAMKEKIKDNHEKIENNR